MSTTPPPRKFPPSGEIFPAEANASLDWKRLPIGAYVHFPFCLKKCPYCDFNSHATPHDDHAYAEAVLAEAEARAWGHPGPAVSLYFGGGTPSRWAPEAVGRVIEELRAQLSLEPDAEITLELNPKTVDRARLAAFVQAGVNRLSVGVQSFLQDELGFLGRVHDVKDAEAAVEAALSTGARVSLDLIYALPSQPWEKIEASLARAIALRPHHISAYTLTIEPETEFGRRRRLGLLKPQPDEAAAAQIERLSERLAEAGWPRYEVSSYAPPGQESRHNSLYWTGGAYLGLGAGAHSYRPLPDGSSRRWENLRNPEAYLRGAEARRFPLSFEEQLSRTETLKDRVMVALRTRFGLALCDLEPLYGPQDNLQRTLEALCRQGLVAQGADGRFRPSARGFLFSDAISRSLIDAVD